jgi:ribosomal protein S18 acetylase RimI-like enzyme
MQFDVRYMEFKKLDTDVHDIKKVSELIYETDKDLFRIFFDKNRNKALSKLQKLILAGGTPYGHEHIYVAEDAGKLMGILAAYRGDEINFTGKARAFANVGFVDFLRLSFVEPIFDRISTSRVEADDFYIGNVAVDPTARGAGIGTFLLKESFKVAHAKNCKKLVLDVLFYNERARHWYEKNGFKLCGEKRFKWFGLKDGTWGMECLL